MTHRSPDPADPAASVDVSWVNALYLCVPSEDVDGRTKQALMPEIHEAPARFHVWLFPMPDADSRQAWQSRLSRFGMCGSDPFSWQSLLQQGCLLCAQDLVDLVFIQF